MNRARQVIKEALESALAPAVLWSGGEHSTLLLSLAREIDESILVIWFYAGQSREQRRFAEKLIMEWDLNVWSWHPSEIRYSTEGLVFEYAFGNDRFPILQNTDVVIPELRTKHLFPEFDLLLSGHRDFKERLGNAKVVTPFKCLSDSELWGGAKMNVPVEERCAA